MSGVPASSTGFLDRGTDVGAHLEPHLCPSSTPQMLDARISQRQTEAGVPLEQQDEQPAMQDSLARFHLVSSAPMRPASWCDSVSA